MTTTSALAIQSDRQWHTTRNLSVYKARVSIALFGNLAVFGHRSVERLARLVSFCGDNIVSAILPENFNCCLTPTGAIPRSSNRLAADDHIDRICVQLWKMTQCNPAT